MNGVAGPRRVLVCTNQLRHIRGSELVTLELVEQFLSRGATVDVANNLYLPPMSSEFEALEGHDRLFVATDPYHEFIGPYDLIWVQHSVLPDSVIEQLAGPGVSSAVVWHHMSAQVHMELPVLADVETEIADVSTAVSPEVAETLSAFGLSRRRLAVFDNPAPDAFAEAVVTRNGETLERLLVVSNHPPEEVLAATDLLRDRGQVQVDVLGEVTGVTRVSPRLLAGYDAVLSIGKTVQYALSMGLPCYVYDHFGGRGWLTSEGFEDELHWNFSGRATRRRVTAAAIADELVTGFPEASRFARSRRSAHAARWRLSSRVDALLDSRHLRRPRTKRLTRAQANRWSAFTELHRGLYRTLEYYKDELARVTATAARG
ncbi:hypothetical protein [Geodermatophilus sp. FMUSA9-8]|uniref:hypothetical protein n=1 Tax=Geodermatophilus sp. FMUSA9-8 TaxID=3120155 RepID=UPI003008004B